MFCEEISDEGVRIKIVGVGGAGNNEVDRLKLDDLQNVHLTVVNTDSQVLNSFPLEEKVIIGRNLTRGLGAGGEAEIGRCAALESEEALRTVVDGVDLVFLLAGLGGGTGSGATPVLAEMAANAGALVFGFVTLPFSFEGARRHEQAQESLEALRKACHAVVPIPNDILLQQVDEEATVLEAFELADQWISRGVRAIWSMLFRTGLINVDFATLRTAFRNHGGRTLFGLGQAEGEDYVRRAISDLKLCPLLHLPDFSRRADSLIVNIMGGPDLTLNRVNEIVSVVTDEFGSKENTVIGAHIEETMQQSLRICVLGTTDPNDGTRSRRLQTVPLKERETVAADSDPDSVRASKPVHAVKSKRTRPKQRDPQEEFYFSRDEEQRGYFESTERNLYEGEDLDVPTYLRRGIKVHL